MHGNLALSSKEGMLRKRSGRMQRWALRSFVLSGPKLSYRLKPDPASPIRGEFDLSAGCVLTEVVEDSMTSIKGRKLFSFWIVWPHDKRSKPHQEPTSGDLTAELESDDEDISHTHNVKHKDLKQIVESEMQMQKIQQQKVEEQLENHKTHDSNVRLGVKVAAVALGGVVIGALTAGIGLIPYMTVVGITAVAGGGAVAMQFRGRPSDSRLILACENMDDAVAWKTAIESEINCLEKSRQPMLPATADPNIVSSILGMSAAGGGGGWRTVSIYEGIRLLEQMEPLDGTRCRKAQLVVHSTPVSSFLSLMESHHWPRGGTTKVDKVIDDHADIISVTVNTECNKSFGRTNIITRELKLCRFWKLDDDGIYLITFNTVKPDILPKTPDSKPGANVISNIKNEEPSFDAVITISPRRDHAEYEVDLPMALIVCTCQLSTSGNWLPGELEATMDNFLKQQLLDLKHSMLMSKYALTSLTDKDKEKTKEGKLPQANISTSQFSEHHSPASASVTTTASSSRGRYLRSSANSESDLKVEIRTTSPGRIVDKEKKSRSFSRFGIATVQPGLEDMQIHIRASSPPNSSTSPKSSTANGNTNTNVNATPSSNSKISIFRRTSKPSSQGSQVATASADVPLKTSAAGLEGGVSEKSRENNRFSSRRKSKAANPKAANLRSQIAAKEYEVQRIEKALKKQASSLVSSVNSTASAATDSNSFGHAGTRGASDIDLASYQCLLKELQKLKLEYQEMTGVPYEYSSSKRSSSLSRLRHLGSGSGSTNSNSPGSGGVSNSIPIGKVSTSLSSVDATNGLNASVVIPIAVSVDSTATASQKILSERNKNNNVPSHWNLTSSTRDEYFKQFEKSSLDKQKYSLFIILAFSLLLSLSTFVTS